MFTTGIGTLIIRTLAIVIDEDVEVLRFELRRRGDSMPADSYQLLEVMEKLQTTLSVDFDINKFQGYLKSKARSASPTFSAFPAFQSSSMIPEGKGADYERLRRRLREVREYSSICRSNLLHSNPG